MLSKAAVHYTIRTNQGAVARIGSFRPARDAKIAAEDVRRPPSKTWRARRPTPPGKVAELYVLGERPIAWLKATRSSVRAKLKGYPVELTAFESAFEEADLPISTFVGGAASHVRLINLEQRLPDLFASHKA